MVKFCKGTYNLITCAEFTDFCFSVFIAVMFSCCLFCSSLFLYVFIVYLYFVFFYSCAASYGVIKNDWAASSALPCSLNRAADGGQLVTSLAGIVLEIAPGYNDSTRIIVLELWTALCVYDARSRRRHCILGTET